MDAQFFRRTVLPAFVLAGMALAPARAADSVTKVINNGGDANKIILAVLGDGYAAADQQKFNDDVDKLVINGVFGHDFYQENHNAFNVYRVNLESTQSGMSTKTYGPNNTVTAHTDKNTALKYIFSGDWNHCWLEHSATTDTLKQAALTKWVPNAQYCIVLLNIDQYGGCNRGPMDIVTPRSVDWWVLAHEMGHGIGGLADEYSVGSQGAYTGAARNGPNVSTVTDKNTVFWNRFLDPATAVPTPTAPGLDSDKSIGIFTGGGTYVSGMYRPVENCRMNSNSPNYCPVCYTIISGKLWKDRNQNFDNVVPVDFDGDHRSDVLIHNDKDLALYRANTTKHTLDVAWVANHVVPGAPGKPTWQPAPHDQYFPGDFDGDGKTDVYVFNGSDWNMPYLAMLHATATGLECVARYDGHIGGFWTMKANDKFMVGDFDGDGKADLYVFNGTDWNMPYLGQLQSTGSALSGVSRHDGSLPGWTLKKNDQFHVGDFDGDHKADLYATNGVDWPTPHVGMLKSTGNNMTAVKTFAGSLPGWQMKGHDQFYVGDLDGDGKADLYVFNGADWGPAYLVMLKSTGADLGFVKRYDSSSAAASTPGWQLRKGDRFWVCDANHDHKADLFVYNPAINWSTHYLGTLLSTGSGLTGSWSNEWVSGPSAGWHLGPQDKIEVANYEGGVGSGDIYIHNTLWLGMLRHGNNGFQFDRHYYKWIYTPLYDKRTWSDTLP